MPPDSRRLTIHKKGTLSNKHRVSLIIISSLIIQATLPSLVPFLTHQLPAQPMRTSSLSGSEYIQEVMKCQNPKRIQEVLRMKLEVFQFLCAELKSKGGLAPSRYVSIEEQVAMFLYAIAHSDTNREVQERFQHSGETVSRHFHRVLQALNRLVPYYIKLPENQIPTTISSNPKFYPFFSDCIGALDGTHIAAKVPAYQAAAYRNRKGFLSQNVLACCEFDDLLFTYVLAGWEGSAHDGAVLGAAFDSGFEVPKEKYYLGDAGFGLAPYCLTPYRGVRYHLREWGKGNERYQNHILLHETELIIVLKMPKNFSIYVTLLYGMQLKGFLEF